MPSVYDWPAAIRPRSMLVVPPGEVRSEELVLAGVSHTKRIKGNRLLLRMEFGGQSIVKRKWLSWLAARLPGSLFRVRLECSSQLAWTDSMKSTVTANPGGIPFSSGSLFSTGTGFRFQPTGDLVEPVLEGTTTAKIDLSRWPGAFEYGVVFGVGASTYVVLDVDYDGDVASVTFTPPARRDYAADEFVALRPSMICAPLNPNAMAAPFDLNRLAAPQALTFREAVGADLV